MVEGLDYENSTWVTSEKWNTKYPELKLLKIALRHEVVQNLNIFRIIESKMDIFISNHLKQCLRKSGVSGFKFLPIKAYV